MELVNKNEEKYLKALVFGEPGCIAGDMRVLFYVRDRDGVTKQNDKGGTMRRLYDRFNGIARPGKGNYQREQTKESRYFVACVGDESVVVVKEIAAVLSSGTKACVTVTTASGRTITCTPDHLFATASGYSPIASIGVGGRVLIHERVVRKSESRRPRTSRPQVYVKFHPFAKTRIVKVGSAEYEYKALSRARVVLEASMNSLTKEEYVKRLNLGLLDGLVFVQPGMDVHHLDENPLNDVPENLAAIPHADHTLEHNPSDRVRFFATEDEIVSIEDAGTQDTYDITMKEPPHNFVVQDFVVHNCSKSSMGATCPDPLILLSERHGATSVYQAAERLGVKRPDTLLMSSLEDYRSVIKAFRGDRSKPFQISAFGKIVLERSWPQTLVVDSLTDACRLIQDEIMATSKDGESMSIPSYGLLKTRAERMIVAFRDVPAHVLFLCLLQDKGEGEERVVQPRLPGSSLPATACAAVNVVALAHRKVTPVKNSESKVEYLAYTVAPSHVMTKPMRPLRDVEELNFTKWIETIFGKTESKTK